LQVYACMFRSQKHQDLSSKSTKLPPGKSCKDGRKDNKRANKQEHAVAKLDCPVAENSQERYGNINHQIKKAKVQGMQSSVEKIAVDSIIAQINVMQHNKEEYILIYGEEKYTSFIVNLLRQLPGHQSSDPSSVPSAGDNIAVGNRAVEDLMNGQDSGEGEIGDEN
jgi:hypothetical protein